MADAQTAYSVLVKAVGATLRAQGFRGPAGSWHLINAEGDLGIVNLQKSKWNTADQVTFIVNLAIVPQPWFEWTRHRMVVTPPTTPKEYHGIWGERLEAREPTGSLSERWWTVTDLETAERCRLDVERQLLDYAVPRLRNLLDRRQLIQELSEGPAKAKRTDADVAAVILMSDEGQTADLEAALARVRSRLGDWKDLPLLEAWVMSRAAGRP